MPVKDIINHFANFMGSMCAGGCTVSTCFLVPIAPEVGLVAATFSHVRHLHGSCAHYPGGKVTFAASERNEEVLAEDYGVPCTARDSCSIA